MQILEDWLYSLLSTTAALTALVGPQIYNWRAPQGTPLLYLVYQSDSGADESSIGGLDRATKASYQIKAVTQDQSFASSDTIAAAFVDKLFQGLTATTGAISVMGVLRQSPIRTPLEHDPGVRSHQDGKFGLRINYVSGVYAFWFQALAG